jgi:ribosomal protein S27AE
MYGWVLTVVLIFAASYVYILYVLDLKPPLKRKLFRGHLILFAVALLLTLGLTGMEVGLFVFLVPVLAFVVFGMIRWTKFCSRCGREVQINLPYVDKEHCPRCGGALM